MGTTHREWMSVSAFSASVSQESVSASISARSCSQASLLAGPSRPAGSNARAAALAACLLRSRCQMRCAAAPAPRPRPRRCSHPGPLRVLPRRCGKRPCGVRSQPPLFWVTAPTRHRAGALAPFWAKAVLNDAAELQTHARVRLVGGAGQAVRPLGQGCGPPSQDVGEPKKLTPGPTTPLRLWSQHQQQL